MKKYILLIIAIYLSYNVQAQDTVTKQISDADLHRLEKRALNNESDNAAQIGVWASASMGLGEGGFTLQGSVNINYKSLLLTGAYQSASEIGWFKGSLESRSVSALLGGYALRKDNFILSFTGGFAEINGIRRGESTYVSGMLYGYTTYDMVSYTQHAIPLEQKMMTRPKNGFGLSFGVDITELFQENSTGLSVMICLSAGKI